MQVERQAESVGVGIQEEEDEQFGPMLVQELEKHGVSSADCKKLQEAGFYTVESVV